jgi:hypothetical protein
MRLHFISELFIPESIRPSSGYFLLPVSKYVNPANGTLYTTFLGKAILLHSIPELLIPGTFHPCNTGSLIFINLTPVNSKFEQQFLVAMAPQH